MPNEDLWTLIYPMRLSDGGLVLHSTAPFSEAGMKAIQGLGRVEILLHGTTMRDTFSREGRVVLSGARYLVPEGFPKGKAGPGAASVAELDGLTVGEVRAVGLAE